MSIAECNAMPPATIGKSFYALEQVAVKSFISRGKLVHSLNGKKLKTGQSVQSTLLKYGAAPGSIDNARKAAKIIELLVLPELLKESEFDKKITARIIRFSSKCLGLGRETSAILEPEQVADIISTMKNSKSIADSLECWHENQCSPDDHASNLKEQAAKEKAAKEPEPVASEPVKPEPIESEPAEVPKVESDPVESESTDEPQVTSEPVKSESTEKKQVASEPTEEPVAPEPVESISADDIINRLQDIRLDAMDLSTDDIPAVQSALQEMMDEMASIVEASEIPAAA